MKKSIGFIYLTTCLINKKKYIGRHEHNNNKNYIGSGTLFSKAVKKYGKENFKREILKECYTLHELEIWEYVYIVKYKTTDRKIGYNIALGNVNSTEYNPAKLPEVREKIKNKIKEKGGLGGKNNPMYGKKWSENKRKQMTEMFIKNPPMKGKHHSEKTKKQWSKIRKGKDPFINLSFEQKQKIYEKFVGKNNPMYGKRFRWINNGIRNKRFDLEEKLPKGWKEGYIRKNENKSNK